MKYHSQIGQDQYFIENIIDFKKNGFFLDIGANNGVHSSNTATLEFELGWTGICVEANPNLFQELKNNRPNAISVQAAAWHENGETSFEITHSNNSGIEGHLLSRIANLDRNNKHFKDHFQESKEVFQVKTKTITSILKEHHVLPCVIDYLSVDTEGAELETLQGIDFSLVDIKFMTVEHGGRKGYLKALDDFLMPHGYKIHRINQWDAEFCK